MKDCTETATSEHLRSMLNSFTADLSLNFLERRGKNKNHKATVLDELQDVIGELNHRERDLKAAVGIALMVLESNDKMQEKLSKSKAKLQQSLNKSHHQSIDIQSLQETLVATEARYEEINKTLVETEEVMLINSAELNRIVRERFQEANIGASDEEIELIKKDFRRELESIQKKRWDLEKEVKKLHESNRACEAELNDYKEGFARLEEKYNKLYELQQQSEKSKQRQESTIESLDSQLKLSNSSYQRLKLHAERLEEEISILESHKVQEKPKLNHAISLQSELEVILDESFELFSQPAYAQGDESIEDLLFMRPTHSHSHTPQTRTSSLVSYSRLFSMYQERGVGVIPVRMQRKAPPEEYFALTAQAVKMNSTHLENVGAVSTEHLYEKAIKAGIPFHKWHVWIESQINAEYVQQLYKKNKRNLWRRYGQKICF